MERRYDEYSDYPKKDSFTKQKIPMFVYLLLIMIGVFFGIVGIFIGALPDMMYKGCTEEVQAVVSQNIPKESEDGDTMFSPEFSYEYGGKEYRTVSSMSSYPPLFDEGEEVTLKVNPDNPAMIHPPTDRFFNIIKRVLVTIGVILCTAAVILFIYSVMATAEGDSETPI